MLPTALYPRQTGEYMAREYRREELEFVASSEGRRPVQRRLPRRTPAGLDSQASRVRTPSRGRPRPALRRPWSSNSPAAAGGGPTRGRPRRSRGGGDELGGRGQLRRREVHERLDAAVRSALRTRPRREQVRKGLRRPVRSSSQSSSSLLGVSGSWSPTCIAGICGRSPARRRAGAASRRTGERRTATTGGRRSGFRRCRE